MSETTTYQVNQRVRHETCGAGYISHAKATSEGVVLYEVTCDSGRVILATGEELSPGPLPTLDVTLAQDPVTVAARVVADTWALCRMASEAHRDGEATAWAIVHRQAQDALTQTRARVEGGVPR